MIQCFFYYFAIHMRKLILAFFALYTICFGAVAQNFNQQISGMWVFTDEEFGKPGRGMMIDIQGSTVVFSYYGYRKDGSATYYIGNGNMVGGQVDIPLNEYANGRYLGEDTILKDAELSRNYGMVTIKFASDTAARIKLPQEPEKWIHKFTFSDIGSTLNGEYPNMAIVSRAQGKVSFGLSKITISTSENRDLKVTTLNQDGFTCILTGYYRPQPTTAIYAEGSYSCDDGSSGEFWTDYVKKYGSKVRGTFYRQDGKSYKIITDYVTGLDSIEN